jgi:hypothetical protein
MTDEERERILRDLPPLEDRLTRWKREADEAEAARARYREQTAAAEVNAQRSMVIEVCDQRIAAALAAALEGVEERRIKVLNAVGDVMYAELAKERKRSDRVEGRPRIARGVCQQTARGRPAHPQDWLNATPA